MNRILLLAWIGVSLTAMSFAADDAAFLKGKQYYQEKKFLLAIGSLKSAIEGGYQDARAYFYLANAYVANQDYDKALDQYKYALEAANDPVLQASVYFNMGYVNDLKKDYKKAVDLFSKAYTVNTNLHQAYWLKGNDHYRLRDREGTIAEWENYLTVEPNGKQSDNIRRALAILKSPDFDFDKYNLLASATNSSSSKGLPSVDPLIDIEGVLGDVKPVDKGKAVNEGLEGIEK
jgi:tetratricopeptide (TPR) repeat protein